MSLRPLSTTLPPKLLLRVQNSERGSAANVHERGKAASGSSGPCPSGQGRGSAGLGPAPCAGQVSPSEVRGPELDCRRGSVFSVTLGV